MPPRHVLHRSDPRPPKRGWRRGRCFQGVEADIVDAFVGHLVVSYRRDALPRIQLWPLYADGDPRAPALLDLVEAKGFDVGRLDVAAAVLDAVVDRAGVEPNVDFALGVLAFAGRMTPDAGEAVFAMARCAGWLAHAIEEYAEAPLRFRLRAHTLA